MKTPDIHPVNVYNKPSAKVALAVREEDTALVTYVVDAPSEAPVTAANTI